VKKNSALAGLLTTFTLLYADQPAHAGGLYFSDRGVRPMGRGGAFVAGADDLGATWYNPAGLADVGNSVLVDASWMNFSGEFTRKSQVVDAGGTVRIFDYPQVSAATKFLPLPTLGFSRVFGDEKQYTFAFSLLTPYAPLMSYPATVGGGPSPSRYSLISMEGSALVIPGGYLSIKLAKQFRIGFGVQLLVGKFASSVVFNANPGDRVVGAPEDPRYDTFSQLSAAPIITPSGNLGLIYEPTESIRLGAAFQLPYWINAPASNRVRLPTAPLFDKARQDGDAVHVKFRLPPIFRIGAELRTKFSDEQMLKVEAAYVREFWSVHDSIDVIPDNINLVGVTGFPSPFGIPRLSIPRNFQDSNSFRLGAEYSRKAFQQAQGLTLRAGVAYETSAIPRAYLSPLTLDSDKVTASVGVGLTVTKGLRIDAVYAHIFAFGATVSPGEAQIPRLNPVQGNPVAVEAINGGTYAFRADVMGLGAEYKY
jgi:long-chain fatty acid transport protein